MRALYQEVILEHNNKPRNFGEIVGCNHMAQGHNPLCGDKIKVTLNVDSNQITKINFNGESCAICKASASMMTTMVQEKDLAIVNDLIVEFRAMITGDLDPDAMPNNLGRLKVFANIKTLPVRVKCAILPWHTLSAALDNKLERSDAQIVSTE